MNILFYLEPHPVRTPLEFKSVGIDILSMIISGGVDGVGYHSNSVIKMTTSRSLHKALSDNFLGIEINKYLIGLTKEENDYIAKNYFGDWSIESLHTWRDLLEGKGEITDFYVKILSRIYSNYKFDVAVAWGTNGAIKTFCSKYNIPLISMELGCTRAPFFESIYFDYLGVNGASYTHQFDLDEYKPSFSYDEISTLLPVSMNHAMKSDAKFVPVNKIENKEKLYSAEGNNVLIPLQLMDDTNILLYSEYSSMEQFLMSVLPDLVSAGFNCYIKPHPGAKERYINQADHDSCKRYVEKIKNVYWCDDVGSRTDLLSFYEKMNYFLVINSSVGFEGMLLNKIVICLAQSPYNISAKLSTFKNLISREIDYNTHLFETNKIVNAILFKYLHLKQDIFTIPTFLNKISYAINAARLIGFAGDSKVNPNILSDSITTWDLETYPRLRRLSVNSLKSVDTDSNKLKLENLSRNNNFIESVVSLCNSGNAAFSKRDYSEALRLYKLASDIAVTQAMKNAIKASIDRTSDELKKQLDKSKINAA